MTSQTAPASTILTPDPNYKADADVGSRAWAGRIRHRARVLAEQVETGYLELGEILYRIYDAPVDGDAKNGSVLAKWGYSSIGEYAEKELSLHYKKAQRLLRIFYRIEVELDGLGKNPDLKRRFIRLGWSKARELVRVLTIDNMVDWINRAETMNYTTLVEVIKRTAAMEQARLIQADIARQPDPIAASNHIPEGLLPPPPSQHEAPVAAPSVPKARPVGDYAEATSEAFVDRKWVSKVFSRSLRTDPDTDRIADQHKEEHEGADGDHGVEAGHYEGADAEFAVGVEHEGFLSSSNNGGA